MQKLKQKSCNFRLINYIARSEGLINGHRKIDYVVSSGNFELLEFMISNNSSCLDEKKHPNYNVRPDTLMTNSPNIEVVKFLINKGYTLDAQGIVELIDKFGFEGLDLLKSHRVDLNMMDSNGETPLKAAMRLLKDHDNDPNMFKTIILLIDQDIEINFSDNITREFVFHHIYSCISSNVIEKDFLNNPLVFDKYGLSALNKILKAALSYQKSVVPNSVYDQLSETIYDEISKHVRNLHKKNFKFEKDIKTILDTFKKIKDVCEELSVSSNISEKERPVDYHTFKLLEEVLKEKYDILFQDQKILKAKILHFLINPNVAEKGTILKTEKPIDDGLIQAFNMEDFITGEELAKFCSHMPSYFDPASTQLPVLEEVNEEPKRQKLGEDGSMDTTD